LKCKAGKVESGSRIKEEGLLLPVYAVALLHISLSLLAAKPTPLVNISSIKV
jgi:hypothetical protein